MALDALTYAGTMTNLADVEDRITFVEADISDSVAMQRVLDAYEIDTVVNFAAESHNSLAVLEPKRFFQTNVIGTQTLLDACMRAAVRHFHHVSTYEVYGGLSPESRTAFTEGSPYRPRTPYNGSKAAADHAVRVYHETFGLPITITNCVNNYGPNQFPEKVLPLFITQALEGRKLPVYAGENTRREWIHVRDHCRAVDTVVQSGRIGETYHVGTGVETSVDRLADIVLDELGLPSTLKTSVAERPGHDRRHLLDSGKIRRELGWRAETDFDSGVRETIRWYAANRNWWAPLRERNPVVETAWASGR